MIIRLGLFAGCIALSGCDAGDLTASGTSKPVETVAAPASLEPGELALFGPNGQIHVGEVQDSVEKVFPAPSTSYGVRDLPPGFHPPYRARGYETVRDGFGALYYGDRVAVAMRTDEDVTADQVQVIVDRYKASFGEPKSEFVSDKVSYWFWYRDARAQRLMVCVAKDTVRPNRLDLTQAVGDALVMTALRMSPQAAEEDQSIGNKLLEKTEQTPAPR